MDDIKDDTEKAGTEPETADTEPKKRGGKNKLFLIIAGSVLAVALVVCAALLLTNAPNEDNTERVVELGTVMQGISVGGIDISGMTRNEALAATSGLEAQLFAAASFTVDVNGAEMNFTAQDFALYTDYESVIEQAIEYGRTGTFDERLAAANAAKENGVSFEVDVLVDEAGLEAALAALKTVLNTVPIDATITFAPWGYTETTNDDGTVTCTAYTPDLETIIEMCDTYARSREYDGIPEDLVRIADEDLPNALRYEYYQNTKFIDGYIPKDANVSRFIYTDAVDGLIVDTDTIYDAVISQVESGTYEKIVAPVEVSSAEVTAEELKSQTQLISSWTSSYSNHYGYNRNYNVAMMSSIINGAVIAPGETWSVNDTAGPREAGTIYKWKKAAGLYNGGTTQQYGGGVCQLGSTTYNACIRSGVTIEDFSHHTIPSDYIPIGLDATLSTPSPDLVLGNDTEYTFYIVSYVNPIDKNVSVEVYGVPLTDDSGEQILLTYDSEKTGRYGGGSINYVEVAPGGTAPNGHVVSAGESYVFSNPRSGTTAEVYQITMSLDGAEISRVQYGETVKYPPFDGYTYYAEGSSETSAETSSSSG